MGKADRSLLRVKKEGEVFLEKQPGLTVPITFASE